MHCPDVYRTEGIVSIGLSLDEMQLEIGSHEVA